MGDLGGYGIVELPTAGPLFAHTLDIGERKQRHSQLTCGGNSNFFDRNLHQNY